MKRKLKVAEVISFVGIGSFNPQIFHPNWFSSEGIIGEEEAESIEVNLNSRSATLLKSAWFSLEVDGQVLKVKVNQEAYYEIGRDLVQGIFQVLNNTPIRAFGINVSANIKFEKASDILDAGVNLFNKETWNQLLEKPRFNQIALQGEKSNKDYAGYQRITIQPTLDESGSIFIDVNDHFEMNEDEQFEVIWVDKSDVKFVRGGYIADILLSEFNNSMKTSREKLKKVIQEL